MRFFPRFPGAAVTLALATSLTLMEQSAALAATPAQPGYLSPIALAATKDGKTLFIACATANRILRFDTASRRVVDSISVPESPSGAALSPDERRLFVTCAASQGVVCIIDVAPALQSAVLPAQSNAPTLQRSDASTFPRSNAPTAPLPELRILARIATGHTAMAPVLSQDGKTLYACNRFNNDVSMIDLAVKKEVCRIPVQREPVAADITKNGRFLLVANHLPTGRADGGYCGAVVSVIDTGSNKVLKELRLPNGSGSLNDLRLSPDGKYAAVTHIVANFKRPAVRPFPDWMNGNALTVIDVAKLEVLGTFLLDERGKGAANPWGLAWSADGATLVVAHSGTHEVSIIDFPALIKRLLDLPAPADPLKAANPATATQDEIELASYLHYYPGPRRRVKLPEGDLGPRAVAVVGHTAYTANYFSDTLTAIDLSNTNSKPESIPLSESGPRNPRSEADQVRKGEFYFHDATICFQGWQSCASCHPGGARADGLNWDLLNDGIGNPKNTKSLLLAFETPPAMWLGVRDTAETAVRSGIKHILFTQQPEEVAAAVDEYLKSLKPVPSPYLVQSPKSNVQGPEFKAQRPKSEIQSQKTADGWRLSVAAERGKAVFMRAGCSTCHPPGLFTDLHQYDVGTRRGFDRPADKFDTPALVELWRTAPYLHDGSAATLRDVLTTRNPRDRHGKTSDLTGQEIEDLCAYLLSL